LNLVAVCGTAAGDTAGEPPAATALRTAAPFVRRDAHTVRMAVPMVMHGEPCGVLSIQAAEPDTFGSGEAHLVEQMAADAASGLERLEADEWRSGADAALAASEHRLKVALDAGGIGTFDWDLAGGRIVWSGHHERIFGFEPGGFGGTYAHFEKRVHPADLPGLNHAVDMARDARTAFRRVRLRGFRKARPNVRCRRRHH
jgi:PAS domain-containing protein